MGDQQTFSSAVITLEAFGKSPALTLDMGKTREAEVRFVEAKTVSPVTYTDLEHTFNESYRELKKNHSLLGYQITMAEKAIEDAKADVLLDQYPAFLEGKPKQMDNADTRKAFLSRSEAYNKALDRLNQLKALESFTDGRIKVIENVCRYMRQKMQLIMRSGLSNADLYITSGKKS